MKINAQTTRSPLFTLTIGCALACLPLAAGCAQDAAPSPTSAPAATTTSAATASSKLAPKEMAFVKKASAGNAAEAKAGELAATNGESQDVKDFGTMMVKDHGDANTELGVIAKAHDITFPAPATAKQKALYEKLSKLKGAAFDKAYVMAMVADHESDLADYKMAKSEVQDADLKGYADKTETVVANHLKMIKDIKTKMMAAKKS